MGLYDWVVLLAALWLSIAVGWWLRGPTGTLDGYLLGNRNLPWWAILGSIVATETSTATVLSVPGHGLSGTGLRFLQLAIGLLLGRCLVVFFLLPLFFSGRLSSAYEVLQQRFGPAVSRVASGMFLLTRSLGDGLRLYLAAMVVQEITGFGLVPACLLIAGVAISYTLVGGMRSIVWNDCVQWCIYMLGGLVSLWVIVSLLPERWGTVWEHGMRTGKWTLIEWDWSANYSLWSGLLGGMVLSMGTHGTDHMMVQRYLSARNQTEAGLALLLSGVVVCFQFALFIVIGVALASFYEQSPGGAAVPDKVDKVFLHFIVHDFPQNTGLVGLMLAAICAATMSTLSSSLNASASAVMHDFVLSKTDEARQEQAATHLWWTRWLTVAFGVVQLMVGIQAASFSGAVIDNALKLAGFSGGLLLGLFVLGATSRRVGQTAALVGALTGAVTLIALEFGRGPAVSLGVPWLALIGAGLTIIVGHGVQTLLPSDIASQKQPGPSSDSSERTT